MSVEETTKLFGKPKVVMGMLHLKGNSDAEVLETLKREYDAYVKGGIDGVIVENYYNTYREMRLALDWLKTVDADILVGVNCLYCESMGFELALEYETDFVQTDSVVGHMEPRNEPTLEAFFDLWKKRYHGIVLGGVRFKKQPILSANTLAEDLAIAKTRCNAVCVTQDRTGQETSMTKIQSFRDGLGDFPLIVSAGATAENAGKALKIADGIIAGSYFKDTHEVSGIVCEEHVRKLVNVVRAAGE